MKRFLLASLMSVVVLVGISSGREVVKAFRAGGSTMKVTFDFPDEEDITGVAEVPVTFACLRQGPGARGIFLKSFAIGLVYETSSGLKVYYDGFGENVNLESAFYNGIKLGMLLDGVLPLDMTGSFATTKQRYEFQEGQSTTINFLLEIPSDAEPYSWIIYADVGENVPGPDPHEEVYQEIPIGHE